MLEQPFCCIWNVCSHTPDCGLHSFRTNFSLIFIVVALLAVEHLCIHPRGNSHCERYIGIIWSSVKLALKKSYGLDISQWECALPHNLHSIRLFSALRPIMKYKLVYTRL